MLRLPQPLTPQSFLERHWQKKPLFVPGGLAAVEPAIPADEVAWLATQPDVEARLVFTEHGARRTRYRVQHGPFAARRLGRLPAENWTLLVHDVDKHLPEFRAWLDTAPFVPDWRVDDLMVSVAAPGGSVGPHRDRYDVFLCQASGRRDWHLAEADEAVPARGPSALALLEPFESPAPITAAPLDVLYLPPSVPHWGIAFDTCVTYSLGMQAPARSELLRALELARPGGSKGIRSPAKTRQEAFYEDPDLLPCESPPGMISGHAIRRAARLLAPLHIEDRSLAAALGTTVTTPKELVAPERPEQDEIDALTARLGRATEAIRVHGMARLAWWQPEEGPALLFANGHARPAGPDLLVEFRHLCAHRMLTAARCGKLSSDGAGNELLRWLIGVGVFDPVDDEV